jgi:hypothetical protein
MISGSSPEDAKSSKHQQHRKSKVSHHQRNLGVPDQPNPQPPATIVGSSGLVGWGTSYHLGSPPTSSKQGGAAVPLLTTYNAKGSKGGENMTSFDPYFD